LEYQNSQSYGGRSTSMADSLHRVIGTGQIPIGHTTRTWQCHGLSNEWPLAFAARSTETCANRSLRERKSMRGWRWQCAVALIILTGGCSVPVKPDENARLERRTDLLTGGLGIDGLRSPTAPTGTDADARRRQAYWSNWRGIADLSVGGGYGDVYGRLAAVPGIEIKSWLGEVGLFHPHGVMLHIPDSFDRQRPCLIVAPVSGSRGIYGAIATAGAWGLTRGCAVVYTDKGAGTGFFDLDAQLGIDIEGAPVHPKASGFAPEIVQGSGIAIKHAHSTDHPESHWGRMTLSSIRFALTMLEGQFPGQRFTADNTRIVAASISNGAGAVLRALERDQEGLIDGVVAAAPQVSIAGAPSLLEYTLKAGLLAPCAQLDPALSQSPVAAFLALRASEFQARCAALAERGLVSGNDWKSQAADARRQLLALGFSSGALDNNATNLAADVWRALAVTYSASYARADARESLCGFRFAVMENGQPRPANDLDRHSWFGASSGIAPTAGVQILGPVGAAPDANLAGLLCLYDALVSDSPIGARLRRGIADVRASARLRKIPTIVIHGRDDGLLPVESTARRYVEAALRNGATELRYWEIENVQHFDAFLGQPAYAARFLPLLPYFYQGLDALFERLDSGTPLPPSQVVRTQRRTTTASGVSELDRSSLGSLKMQPHNDEITMRNGRMSVPD
jgi:hydroxybutyrate-dimer hydrolase